MKHFIFHILSLHAAHVTADEVCTHKAADALPCVKLWPKQPLWGQPTMQADLYRLQDMAHDALE